MQTLFIIDFRRSPFLKNILQTLTLIESRMQSHPKERFLVQKFFVQVFLLIRCYSNKEMIGLHSGDADPAASEIYM